MTRQLAGTAADQVLGFGHNPASQIATRTNSNDAYASSTAYNVSRAYAANGQNQYTSAGPASFTYDANGNLISDGSTSFVYDVENRLVSASGAHQATLAYDPLGRLWQVGGPAGTTRFVYDGDDLVEEYDAAGYRPRIYVHGPGADEPLVWYEFSGGPVHRFYHSDAQGSIVALADDGGNALAINAYDAWGIPNAGNQGRFQYTGQVWIAELGMYYYKARFYSPTLGRFPQVDPIGYDDQINLYAYVGNDPVNNEDPTGEQLIERYKPDHEVVTRVNAAVSGGRPQTVQLNKSTRMTVSVRGNNARVSITHTERVPALFGAKIPITVRLSGTGNLSVKPGNVTIGNIRLGSETPGVSVKSAPGIVTLRNEPDGRIGVHTNAPLKVSFMGIEKTVPKLDKYINERDRK
jgi:RHS repeat-associated protein